MRTAALAIAVSLCARSAFGESPLPERAKRPPFQLMATAFGGDGLRFNNPYRLSTPLGSTAESVSRTNAYVDLGLAIVLGDPRRVQHGFAARLSFAVEGVPQGVIAPSYLVWWRPAPAWAAYARASLPIVLTPNVTWGLEGGLGGVWFFRAGLGAAAEIVGDVYYGAGTKDVKAAVYPVLSGQLGFVIAYEVLP